MESHGSMCWEEKGRRRDNCLDGSQYIDQRFFLGCVSVRREDWCGEQRRLDLDGQQYIDQLLLAWRIISCLPWAVSCIIDLDFMHRERNYLSRQ